MTALPALELRSIEKRFGPVTALAGATLTAAVGALHVLLGENGAGKTTLLRIAAGFLNPDSGGIIMRGHPVRWCGRAQSLRAGVAVVEQHFSLVPTMTVAENVALAATGPCALFSPSAAAVRVERIAATAGLHVDPHAVVSSLSVAAQQRAEIVKALAMDASLLIMDEPTAVLTPAESDELFAWLREFVAGGRTAVIITHRIREALEYGDSLTVLREARTVFDGARSAIGRDDLITAIMGECAAPSTRVAPFRPVQPREVVAALQHVSVRNEHMVTTLQDATLEIRRGEIVGVVGVEGSGQRPLLRVLAGRLAPTSGTVSTPPHCAFIPEDRRHDALIDEMSLTENLAIRGLGSRGGLLNWDAITRETRAAIATFSVRAHDEHQPAGTLSGGNQQKFVLARELADHPELIVAENPTRGLDMRASAEVTEQLIAARNSGSAVVYYSSDVEDLVSFVDRIVVCYAGSVREVAKDFTAVGNAMLGVT